MGREQILGAAVEIETKIASPDALELRGRDAAKSSLAVRLVWSLSVRGVPDFSVLGGLEVFEERVGGLFGGE
jgi:hypothetical protein